MSGNISDLHGRYILDSRGNPTVEVDCFVDGRMISRAAVPSGASTGRHEAVELRDGGDAWQGMGVESAVANVNGPLSELIVGMNLLDDDAQPRIDEALLGLCGDSKSQHGANAVLGISLACFKAGAELHGRALWEHFHAFIAAHADEIGERLPSLPVPMMNILNGGAHANSDVDVQEFMVVPHGFDAFETALHAGVQCYHALKEELERDGLLTGLGDEGGFAPNLPTNEEGLRYMQRAIGKAGYSTDQIGIALDVAASEFHRGGLYDFDGRRITGGELAGIYRQWADDYPLISIEDPFDEDDWESWRLLTAKIGDSCQIVGDDLYVTQFLRLHQGVQSNASNSILIKLNQVGTVSETIETMGLAWNSGYTTVISHRSGETADTTIADLAVGTGAGQIKTGAPARTDRTAKYNQLLRISESVNEYAAPFSRS